jgi:tetratricopeptide (TPR) repeat protein
MGIEAATAWHDMRSDIKDGIDNAHVVIVVISSNYLVSEEQRIQLTRAKRLGKPMCYIVLGSIPAKELPLGSERTSTFDFSQWQDDVLFRRAAYELISRVFPVAAERCERETVYLQNLIQRLGAFAGVQDYVDLLTRAENFSASTARSDRDDWAKELAREARSVQFARRAAGSSEHDEASELENIHAMVGKLPRFVLIGPPGSGKTTTVRRLALQAAEACLESSFDAPIPLFIQLREWTNDDTPAQFIRQQWTDVCGLLGDAEERLENGFLFFDGLDEIRSHPKKKIEQLDAWLLSCKAKRVIVTYRTKSYADEVQLSVPVVRVEDLNEAQIREFAQKYLGREADSFLAQILPHHDYGGLDTKHLSRLAQNPCFLFALIVVYRQAKGGSLPQNPGTLFQLMARSQWRRSTEKEELDPPMPFEELERAFGKLAYNMIADDKAENVPVDWAKRQLVDGPWWRELRPEQDGRASRLLETAHSANWIEVDQETVHFFHPLMQAYFAATVLQHDSSIWALEEPSHLYVQGADSFGWREGKWDQSVIALCGIRDADNVVSHVSRTNPYLAAQCIERGATVSERTEQDVIGRLLSALRYASLEHEFWSGAYEWDASGLDPDSILALKRQFIRARAVSGLALLGNRAVPGLVSALTDGQEVSRLIVDMLAGMKPEVIPSLLDALRELGAPMPVRRSVAEAIVRIGDHAEAEFVRVLRDGEFVQEALRLVVWAALPTNLGLRWEERSHDDDVFSPEVSGRAAQLLINVAPSLSHGCNRLRDEFRLECDLYPNIPSCHTRLILLQIILKQFDQAREDYQNAINNHLADADMHKHVGMWLYQAERYGAALEALERAIIANPDDYENYFVEGIVHARIGDFERAVVRIGDAIDRNSKLPFLYGHRANAYRLLEQYDCAAEDYVHLVELDPHNPDAHYGLGLICYEAGNPDTAMTHFSQAIELAPGEMAYRQARADAYAQLKQFNEAIRDLTVVINHHSNAGECWNERGLVYAVAERYTAAIADFTRAIALQGDVAAYYSNRALVYARLKRDTEAMADFSKAIELEPGNAQRYVARMEWHIARGDEELALVDIAQAIKAAPEDTALAAVRARLYIHFGRYEEAIEAWTALIRKGGPNEAAWYNERGLTHHHAKDYDSAVADFTRAIALQSDVAVYYSNRALANSALKNNEAALADADCAIVLSSGSNPATHCTRALIRGMSGDYRGAILDYDAAIDIDGQYYKAYAERTLLRRLFRDYKGAISDAEAAIRLAPDQVDNYLMRAHLLADQNEFAGAAADYTQVIQMMPTWSAAYNFRALANLARSELSRALSDLDAEPTLKRDSIGRAYNLVWHALVYRLRHEADKELSAWTQLEATIGSILDNLEKQRILALADAIRGDFQASRLHLLEMLAERPRAHHICMQRFYVRLLGIVIPETDIQPLVSWFDNEINKLIGARGAWE